jgi:predicted oxidoreductase (fatty acid repression mutant protein)
LAKIRPERWILGTKDRISGFAGAYGTILFWDDGACADALKENAPDICKDKADEWVHQSNGMHQYYVWTALSALGLGFILQHYNPLIDVDVKRTWKIPSEWRLRAQMVFGVPKDGSELEKKEQKQPIEQRLNVFGAKM